MTSVTVDTIFLNKRVLDILERLELELKNLNYWKNTELPLSYYNSMEPFFMDKMELHEWLQFVLIRKFREIIYCESRLPASCKVFPYAFEFYKNEKAKHMQLLKIINELDRCFSDN
ncbi:MAG: YqcC family protein [Ruminobacter sp.]|jgi:uncharacterized protein YqcC (DUF446 family)|nr:YqcC family protein [Ruminobacter sp.]